MMLAQPAFVGARGTDSVTALSQDTAQALKSTGIDFAVRYLGSVTSSEVAQILNAGLAFMPVTYADRFDGSATVSEAQALELPANATIWLDAESVKDDPPTLRSKINLWARDVAAARFMPGLYVGAGVGLTSIELYALAVVRYWRSMSRIVDRNGQLAEPACGFCLEQLFDTVTWAGLLRADINFARKDWRGRVANWVVAA